MTSSDPLGDLAALPGVADACDAARQQVDALLWDRSLRTKAAALAKASVLQGARASAAMDGADVRVETIASGAAMDGSPVGQVVAAAVRVTGAVPEQLPAWRRAPLQVLAGLHALAARAFVDEERLGRPRPDERADDPLRLGATPAATTVAPRLDLLGGVLTAPTSAPALVVAAVAHGEVAVLRPFAWGSGLVARATTRLVLGDRGVDPDLLTVPEVGFLVRGRPAYVAALRAYASGTPAGLAEWLVWHAEAVALGARESAETLAALP